MLLGARAVGHLQHPARRDPGSLRRAGDHRHRVPGPEPAGGRRSGHLPARQRHARRARLDRRARLQHVRAVVRLRALRGRHRHLLGAQPRARVPELRARPPAGGRRAEARPRRDRRRLGAISTSSIPASTAPTIRRASGTTPQASAGTRRPTTRRPTAASALVRVRGFEQRRRLPARRRSRCVSSNQDLASAAQPAGLVPALSAHRGRRRRRGRRRSAASSRSTRSCSTRSSCRRFKLPLRRRRRRRSQRSNNDVGGSVVELSEHEYMVRSRGYLRGLDDLGAGGGRRRRERHAGAARRRRHAADRRRGAARHRRVRRHRRSGRRRRHRALRRERLPGDPATPRPSSPSSRTACRRACSSRRPTTARR